jgi:hypothetical protein
MNDLKEQAKIIIAKGKKLNDPELVRMGLEMLDAYDQEIISANPIAVQSSVPTEKKTIAGRFDMGEFTMSKAGSNVVEKSGRKQPISTGQRNNKYVDEGEHRDIVTPNVKQTERTRKSIEEQKVNQICEVCGKRERVLPIYAREFYRCESCLLKGKS